MAIVRRTNNRVLPNNSRQVDVAKRTLAEITPVQQQRTMNAFRVEGYDCVLYHKLKAGPKCTCQASGKQLNTILGEDGKASTGIINELLTGGKFEIQDYGATLQPFSTSELHEGDVFGFTSDSASDPYANASDSVSSGGVFEKERIEATDSYGDNGPVTFDLDSLTDDYDGMSLGFMDVSCPVCFGTSFVGGYAPMYSWRHVLVPQNVRLADGASIQYDQKPWAAQATGFTAKVRLPRGALAIEAFYLWYKDRRVPFTFTVDGVDGDRQSLLKATDGKVHELEVKFKGEFTHFEIQFNVSTESTMFEFPRTSKSTDVTVLDGWEPFQLLMSLTCRA